MASFETRAPASFKRMLGGGRTTLPALRRNRCAAQPVRVGHETDYPANRRRDPGRGELVSAACAHDHSSATAAAANGD